MVHNTALSKPKTCCSPLLCHHLELCSLEACLQMASFSPSWMFQGLTGAVRAADFLWHCGIKHTSLLYIATHSTCVLLHTMYAFTCDPLRLIHLFPFLSSKLNDFDLFGSLNVGSPKNSKVTLAQVYVDLCCDMIINDHYFVLNCNVYLGIFW